MNAQALCGRAIQLYQHGNLAEAERLFLEALALEPQNFTALHVLGVLRAGQDRKDEALDLIGAALRVQPDAVNAMLSYSNVLQELGRYQDALVTCDHALSLKPGFAPALYNRGNALREMERWNDALAAYDQALAVQPDYPEALSNSAAVLRALGRMDEALARHGAALTLAPDNALVWGNHGNLLRELKRHDAALESYQRALALAPGRAAAWDDQGVTLWHLLRFEDSIKSFDRAIAADPSYIHAYLHKALCTLTLGRLAEGLPLLEWRKKLPGMAAARIYPGPLWTGREDIIGKTLLVTAEEGLGDIIQFYRYVLMAQARGANVIFLVQRNMHRLLASADAPPQLTEDIPPQFDYHIPLLSLPLAFGTGMENIPAPGPYLRARNSADWAARIGTKGLRIGIVWQGHKVTSVARSFALAHFEPLSRIPDVRLISLQKNDGIEQLNALPPGMRVETLDGLDMGPDAFLDTAAVMENLDLIITSDTSIAHLAGALGRPVWVALPHVSDWRWFLGRDDNPWYPSMRLFRQDKADDWSELFGRIAAAVAALTT